MHTSDPDIPLAPTFDYSAWEDDGKLFVFPTISDAVASGFRRDGVYKIGTLGVDLLVDGLHRLNADNPAVLVNFSADVSDRANKRGPFFSGVGIAKGMGMPLIAVADPSVTYDRKLSLGWYAGNERHPHMADDIAVLLDGLAMAHGCKLVLFGGSGGGFATLNVLSRLTCSASGLANNPQTSLPWFWGYRVLGYLEQAFPTIGARLVAQLADEGIGRSVIISPPAASIDPAKRARLSVLLSEALAEAGVTYNVTDVVPADGALIYLQNRDDWHIKPHSVPFMQSGTWRRVGRRSFASTDRHAAIYFGAWGEGHYAPPKPVIVEALSALRDGVPVGPFVAKLDAQDDGLDPSEFDSANLKPNNVL